MKRVIQSCAALRLAILERVCVDCSSSKHKCHCHIRVHASPRELVPPVLESNFWASMKWYQYSEGNAASSVDDTASIGMEGAAWWAAAYCCLARSIALLIRRHILAEIPFREKTDLWKLQRSTGIESAEFLIFLYRSTDNSNKKPITKAKPMDYSRSSFRRRMADYPGCDEKHQGGYMICPICK